VAGHVPPIIAGQKPSPASVNWSCYVHADFRFEPTWLQLLGCRQAQVQLGGERGEVGGAVLEPPELGGGTERGKGADHQVLCRAGGAGHMCTGTANGYHHIASCNQDELDVRTCRSKACVDVHIETCCTAWHALSASCPQELSGSTH
jgi:hypothetical protein